MDFINKAIDKIAKAGTSASKKAKDMSGVVKWNSQIATNENTIKSIYAEIGKYVYENLREDAPAEMAEKMDLIDAAKNEIAKCKEEIRKLKGIQLCTNCNNEVEKTMAFCPSCGNKMPEPVVDVVDEGAVNEVVEEACEEVVEEAADACEEKAEESAE